MINYCPHCFQSRGPAAVRARGGGATWPHYNGERAENGNYIESEEVAKRHGVCGDPEQVQLVNMVVFLYSIRICLPYICWCIVRVAAVTRSHSSRVCAIGLFCFLAEPPDCVTAPRLELRRYCQTILVKSIKPPGRPVSTLTTVNNKEKNAE